MKTIWDKSRREELERRIDLLRPTSRPLWGKFTAPKMVRHLIDQVRMSSGDLPVEPRNTPFKRFPIKQIIIYVAPFPKGAPTAPALLAEAPGDWSADVALLKRELSQLASESQKTFPEHPAFGKLSRTAWGVLVYKHTDHHLKQFGV